VALSEKESINRRQRWQPDGNMEYFGTYGQPGKIKGIPNRLGEIESQLSKIHNVEQHSGTKRKKKATNIW
jgi:hypothetical protein